MKRNISLYIENQLVDLDKDNLILFNYTQEELDNPTIVKNSYSQQITLKGTPTNNKIFSSAFRLDKSSSSGFNPRLKADFVIYTETGEILQSGYAKLDNITRNTDIEYKVTLYGELGSILYDLSYNADGSKRTLADLDYLGTQEPESEFDYTIDRFFIRTSWSVLAGTLQNPLGEILNFAPCYNGKPSGFAADKAVIDGSYVGRSQGVNFQASLAREYTEQETQDLRSYLQRPVLKVTAVIDAIERYINDRGWSLNIEQDLWESDFVQKTWMTLPMLDVKDAEGHRTGVTFRKADILAGTCSPAEFLLSFCKMFGLKIWSNDDSKTIYLMERYSFFNRNIVDISSRINLSKGRTITPLLINSKWYEMKSEDKGEFAEKYTAMYGRIYGSQRINTGYQFNSDIKTITDNIVFKGGVQSMESSSMFLSVYNDNGDSIPAPFIDGGTYKVPITGTDKESEYSLVPSRFSYVWFNQDNKGYDFTDMVQLHGTDNKPIDGAGVLLFFEGMEACPGTYRVSDDIPEKMVDKPCWNLSMTNTLPLLEIPHFSRFQMGQGGITETLDWGLSQEINIPGVEYDQPSSVYLSRWSRYLGDRYDQDTKMVTLHVNLSGMQVGVNLLRQFYWFDNCIWSLNKIKNHSLTSWDETECEFVQVQNINNYR